jgi:hypothetical protein
MPRPGRSRPAPAVRVQACLPPARPAQAEPGFPPLVQPVPWPARAVSSWIGQAGRDCRGTGGAGLGEGGARAGAPPGAKGAAWGAALPSTFSGQTRACSTAPAVSGHGRRGALPVRPLPAPRIWAHGMRMPPVPDRRWAALAQCHPLRSAPSPARAPVERGKCRRHRIGGDVVLPHGQERPGKMGRVRKRSRAPRGLQNARPGERLGGADRSARCASAATAEWPGGTGHGCRWRGGGARHPRSRWQMRSRRARVPGTAAGAPRRWPGERAPSGWLVERGRAQGNPSSASEEDAHVGGQTSARPVLTARGRLRGLGPAVRPDGCGMEAGGPRAAGCRGLDRVRPSDAAMHAWRCRLQGLGRVPHRAGGGAREQSSPGPCAACSCGAVQPPVCRRMFLLRHTGGRESGRG